MNKQPKTKLKPRKLHATRCAILIRLAGKRRKKYNATQNTWNVRVIDDIIYNEKSHIVSVFKDFLIYDDNSEFLKRYYFHYESVPRLPKIIDYYIHSTRIAPNYALMNGSKIIMKGFKKKDKIGKQGDENVQANSKTKPPGNKNNHHEERLFTDKLKDSIEKIKPSISHLDLKDISVNANEQSSSSLVSIFQSLKTITFLNDMKISGNNSSIPHRLPSTKISIIKEKISKSGKPLILDASKSKMEIGKIDSSLVKDNKLSINKLKHGDLNINLNINFNTITSNLIQEASAGVKERQNANSKAQQIKFFKTEVDSENMMTEGHNNLATSVGTGNHTLNKYTPSKSESTKLISKKDALHVKTNSITKTPISLTKPIIGSKSNFNTISNTTKTSMKQGIATKLSSKQNQLSSSQSKIGITSNMLSNSTTISNQKGVSIGKGNLQPPNKSEKSNIMNVFIHTPNFINSKCQSNPITVSEITHKISEINKLDNKIKCVNQKQSLPKQNGYTNIKYNTIEVKESDSQKMIAGSQIGSHFRKSIVNTGIMPSSTLTNFPKNNNYMSTIRDNEPVKTLPNEIFQSKGLKITEIINCEKRSTDFESQMTHQIYNSIKDNLKDKHSMRLELNSINTDHHPGHYINTNPNSTKAKDAKLITKLMMDKPHENYCSNVGSISQQLKASLNMYAAHNRMNSSKSRVNTSSSKPKPSTKKVVSK